MQVMELFFSKCIQGYIVALDENKSVSQSKKPLLSTEPGPIWLLDNVLT
jgi:hypothetical protein